MRGPQLKTPLLFLLLLFSSLTGTAFCEDTSSTTAEPSESTTTKSKDDSTSIDPGGSYSDDTSLTTRHSTTPAQGPDYPTLILIPVVLAVIIIGAIICGVVIMSRCSEKLGNQESSKEDPHLEGSSTEKVPMPMFEEDVPSVLELEMDELDQWMKKDS